MKHDWSPVELAAQWSLLPTEREFLGNKTGATRLGFAVLLIDLLIDTLHRIGAKAEERSNAN